MPSLNIKRLPEKKKKTKLEKRIILRKYKKRK